jgi:hypothetical protein
MTASVQIGILRLCSQRERIASEARRRLARPLLVADLAPAGLPPAAVMVVRRFLDPLPRQIQSSPRAIVNPDWVRAVREALSQLYRNASRPARGPVPAGAEAVVFSDEAEMLACLLHDAASHEAPSLWWWKRVRRPWGSWQPAALAADRPECVPAALTDLAARTCVARVLNAMTPQEAHQLMKTVLDASEIPPLAPARPLMSLPTEIQNAPSWIQEIVRDSAAIGLGPERERLLATALILHRDRAVLTLPAVRNVLAQGPTAARDAMRAPPPADRPSKSLPTDSLGDSSESRGMPESAFDADPPVRDGSDRSEPIGVNFDPIPEFGPAISKREPSTPSHFSEESATIPEGETSTRSHKSTAIPESQPPTSPLPTPRPAFSDEGFLTECSGVLFLINVLRSLELPESLASQWGSPEPANLWELVDAVARGLLDSVDPPPIADPIWPALAVLGNRELMDSLGGSFPERDRYDLPRAWLNRWGGAETESYAYAALGGRLYLWSRARYLLARHDQTAFLESQARQILHDYFDDPQSISLEARAADERPLESLTGMLAANLGAGLRDWLSMALPYIRQRIARSLGIEPVSVADAFLRRPGRVYLTRTHVDLVLPLSAATVEIRRAGLDFDPGWVPRLGRIVQFHYE